MSHFTGSTIGRYTGRWLLALAVFELALAALFVGLALAVPFVADGFLVTAAILGLTGVLLFVVGLRVRRSAATTEHLARTGLAGEARVTGLTQTGMFLNENPQVAMDLLVQLPGRETYAAQRREFVPLILLGRLTSGQPLPVKVDPADPQRLIIDWAAAARAATAPAPAAPGAVIPAAHADQPLPAIQAALEAISGPVSAAFATAAQGSQGVEQLREHLRQHGVPATARIDQVMDMGRDVGDERLYTLQVTLELPGQPPEKLPPSAALVPLAQVPKVRAGWRVPVRVAADNHQLLTFEWEKL